MRSIAFVDTEIEPKSGKILDIGGVKNDGVGFHKNILTDFVQFLQGTEFVCGHNILNHDIKYIGSAIRSAGILSGNVIDTLWLSPLLFPKNPYHALLKDDKLQTEELNNPLNDAHKAKDLFYDEVAAFNQLDAELKVIFYLLLRDKREFSAFFRFIGFTSALSDAEVLIQRRFQSGICGHADLSKIITEHPIELAYSLSLIHADDEYSITPPWVLRNYPGVERVMYLLRNKPCVIGCSYCDAAFDVHNGLKRFFGFPSFRIYGDEALQEKAVQAAVDNKSLLAVFPTGGGKSLTFQLPALMSGENAKGLTVVISPLQSLMKDQVDNLEKENITSAVTINGLLDPIERAKSFERVENGSASMLYISPESLRSRSIERLLLGRKVVRFVIDEAHCFSSWGQDFRVDYLYIGDFIKSLQETKNLEEGIPVSCFTATAKPQVIQDIGDYFREKLALDLVLFTSKTGRTNLQFNVFAKKDEGEKYDAVRALLDEKDCPTIIYVSRTRRAYGLAEDLRKDGFNAKPYHGKMEPQEKTANQNAFIAGEVQIMVATSAFGMGVDKKDVGMVIHYDISDSLENYIQEAGRAGRDESIVADCYVLFNEEDLDKHFILLNQTKLSIKEIKQIWKAIKGITKFRSSVSNSALEIARRAGWDDNVAEIETRVHTAISALEESGYLKRGQNMPKIFANSILSKNAQEAIDKINASAKFNEKQKEKAIRIIKKLFSQKSRKISIEDQAESRIDYISDHLGIVKEEVIEIINVLREENILADSKDLSAFIKKGDNKNRSLQILEAHSQFEKFLLPLMGEAKKTFHIKELNEKAGEEGYGDISPQKIKTILNFWSIKNWIKRKYSSHSMNHVEAYRVLQGTALEEKMEKRHELARFIVGLLYEKSAQSISSTDAENHQVRVEFSVQELKDSYENAIASFGKTVSIADVEDTLFYLSRIGAIQIEGGFLVTYNRLTIDRVEADNRKQYTADDYKKLGRFYENKTQQIHIVGEYAKKMISDYEGALQFVEDYFQLNYSSFLQKHFPGSKVDDIKLKISPAKFKQIFGELSTRQLAIIKDTDSKYIAVAAGPGSGKTRLLVHKLASLMLMEDVKHEQLLMLTFSRAAATEFKQRLLKLYGNAAHYIDIRTFHSYCFDLLGKVGNLDKSDTILKAAIEKIKNKEVERSAITKTVLVIDEAQDMSLDEYGLIKVLMEKNEDMRVIAVGDDDQNIYEFRGSDSKHFEDFILRNQAVRYEMVENYRSKSNLVAFTNAFVERVSHRLKEIPIVAIKNGFGNLRVVRYNSKNLVTPLVHDIRNTGLSGTTCVLTATNNEALQIAGLLLNQGVQAKLIQSNEGFNLYNLLEIRTFLNLINIDDGVVRITEDQWEAAKHTLRNTFQKSTNWELCQNMIKAFEANYGNRSYKSDLEVFIRESKLEDFYNERGETIFVSTIHKAKGKEFDNVFLMLDHFKGETDEGKRQIYVGMTRAKENLSIHVNTAILDGLTAGDPQWSADSESYSKPDELVMQLSFKDLWLDYFVNRQSLVSRLMSGDVLTVKGNYCLDSGGQSVLGFSKSFISEMEKLKERNYELKSVRVNFIVYWPKEGREEEVKIVLPEVVFGEGKENNL